MNAHRTVGRACALLAIGLVCHTARAQTMPGMPGQVTSMSLDTQVRVFVRADLLEFVPTGTGSVRVDGLSWIGGDYNRVYVRVDGTQPVRGGGETAVDLTYGRLLTPFWTGLLGGRLDMRGLGSSHRSTRGLVALGFEGMSPYFFEVEPTVYVSTRGDVSARFVTALDLLFTQRLVLQPRVETNLAVQDVPDIGVGSGINDIEVGARMRYELSRQVAPYVGLSYSRTVGRTAVLARAAGERVTQAAVVFGARLWR